MERVTAKRMREVYAEFALLDATALQGHFTILRRAMLAYRAPNAIQRRKRRRFMRRVEMFCTTSPGSISPPDPA